MMEMTTLNSGSYSDVRRSEFVAGGMHSDDVLSNRSPVLMSMPVTPNQVSSKLHYSDAGPHREMAVDCPANFVGVKKEPPRLPRPLSNVIQAGSLSSTYKSSQTSLVASPGKSHPTSGSSLSIHSQQAVALEPVDSMASNSKFTFSRDERDRSERLRRYQEEHAKKREMEERINQEQEQLRASLRGSKKMQGLEEKRAKAHVLEMHDGFDNPNYCADNDPMFRRKTAAVTSESKLTQDDSKHNQIVEHMSKSIHVQHMRSFLYCCVLTS